VKKKNVWETIGAAISERGMSWDNSDERDPTGQRGATPSAPGPGKKSWMDPQMKGVPWKGDRPGLKGLPPEDDGSIDVDIDEARPRSQTMNLPLDYHKNTMPTPTKAPTAVVSPDQEAQYQNAPGYDQMPVRRRQSAPTRQIPIRRESTGAANGAGFQAPLGSAEEAAKKTYREMVDEVFMETVRKLPNGKFGVYLKNKGKKKAPKKAGEYTTKTAAREAEIAKGGKTGEAAKKERERINKLKKDPKKMAAANAKDRKKKVLKQSLVRSLTDGINEALFREDDIPGSTWDERLAGISPTALASNKRLAGHTKSIHKASVASLMDGHKLLSKALKGHGKLNHGEIGTETGGKMYLPCKLNHDDNDMGVIHLYIDGGNVKMEMDDDMNEAMDGMEDEGHGLRGAIMAFSQKQLPKIDGAKIAYSNRDKDLDRWEKEHDDELSGRDGLSLHLLKHLIGAKHGRRYR
jgi:hypothetical protein